MFKKYSEYIKDNPEGYWFKRKIYGWGWTPVRWQGWITLLFFIFYIVINSPRAVGGVEPTGTDLNWFFAKVVLSIIVLLIICYKKGEKPRWQWGLPRHGRDEPKDK